MKKYAISLLALKSGPGTTTAQHAIAFYDADTLGKAERKALKDWEKACPAKDGWQGHQVRGALVPDGEGSNYASSSEVDAASKDEKIAAP